MCTPRCVEFATAEFSRLDLGGLDVLEVGSFDVNGSVRGAADQYHPQSYIGVDIAAGPSVDVICSADDLVKTFGESSFDVVVSTEMLEHVADWKSAITQMKRILRPGGRLVLTTRSPGFPLHGYPADFWRFTSADMGNIFADFDDLMILSDDIASPGVFVAGTKSPRASVSLGAIAIYSIVLRRRRNTVSRAEILASKTLILAKKRIPRFLVPTGRRVIQCVQAGRSALVM